ncbi:hypothetical protein [Roseivirga sp. E12]|uniref:hypothetical protein n=1 Tax=Roseivirga sp. E12 TaxID=2819237 RepID=UPI001ABC4AE0|nr:hypothetical protein [Roseivirga sp. E12]MBO3698041.1 hypothetical protein [Roseivirga sp. E12]
MRKLKFIVLLLLPITVAYSQSLSKGQQIRLMYSLIEEHDSDSYAMLQSLAKLPTKYKLNGMTITTGEPTKPEAWLSGKTAEDIRGSLNTVVHESLHNFTSYYPYQMLSNESSHDYDFGDSYSAFMIDGSDIALVKHTDVYNSNELKRDIPKALRTFRYNPYITPKSNLGSQKQGIYGLLDEFNAYFRGTLISYKLFPVYREMGSDNPSAYLDYMQNMSSIRMAYFEFKYYMLAYLNRAETSYPEQYEGFMSNQDLRRTYTLIHDQFEQLNENIDQRITKLMADLNNQGIESYIKDNYFWVQNRGIGMNLEAIELLKEELSKSRYTRQHDAFVLN